MDSIVEALWKAPLAVLEILAILGMSLAIVAGAYLLAGKTLDDQCHQSPQTQRIVCQTEPIGTK
jgi:hypothetical protein